jgi:hypothetical protein
MDTVNKVVSAASHAVWGEEQNKPGEEPVSGQKGQGTATDPYDAGNKDGKIISRILLPYHSTMGMVYYL